MTKTKIDTQLTFFKKVSLFQNLSEARIKELMKIMSVSAVKRDDMIAVEGANEDSLFILLEGEVEISKRLLLPLWSDESVRQEKSLIRLGAKDHCFFGEMALFEDIPERSASIIALKPCTLAVLQKKELLQILEKKPEIGAVIFRNISTELTRRVIKANRDILKLATAFSLALEGD